MLKRKILVLAGIFFLILSFNSFSFSQVPPGQEMSGEVRTREMEKRDQQLRKQIEHKKKIPEAPPELTPPQPQIESQEKIDLKRIDVTGATLIPEKDIRAITKPLENKEVTIKDLQKAADMITDLYRQNGYITSRAYLPPQKIAEGSVEIRILEGVMGDVNFTGNRYFKTSLLRKKITLRKGQPFDYNSIRQDLIKINEQQDRFCKTVLAPGKEPGTTDLNIEVKDKLPIHAGFDWDNFGSRYIDKQRYSVRFTHNNLLGFDDQFTFQYQLAQSSRYYLKSIRYLYPVNNSLDIGTYAALSRVKLGQEFEDSDARGKSQLYGIFANQSLLDTENFDVNLNVGFDYKNITNYQDQAVSSHDKLSIAKAGFDMDLTDTFGRTLFTYELDCGIPEFFGAMHRKDDGASRSGAGGKFVKSSINLLRLQKLPFSTTLLWKNQIQMSPYILSAAEQFQVGGITNVRGYPPAEVVGDDGYTMTFELSSPIHLIPKEINVPFTKTKIYDALRIIAFYDWGNVHLKRPLTTENKNKTLRSAGCGMRFNLPQNLSARVEVAWPLDSLPSDARHVRTWAQITKDF
ncbi:MAG: BamA/TamA family outer membrane protein [Candidatus Omnitrophica bacterium]|nr:BamA/TamA family outer membrane protein [Candidatus Omnitrophota bacterium]